MNVYDAVRTERDRQNDRWGGPEHDDTVPDTTWLAVLVKQVGKVGECALRWSWHDTRRDTRDVAKQVGQTQNVVLRRCLVKVAAVAVAWAEAIDRRDTDG